VQKIAFFEIDAWEEEYLRGALSGYDLFFTKERLTDNTVSLAKDATVFSSFIFSTLTKELLSQLPSVKLIATLSTGYDHIDLKYCNEKGIVVSNVPSYGEHTVAEHTFALILALSRNLIPSVERTRQGDFSLDGLRGFELYGKTLGVIGEGKIGKRVITIARCFGMNVLVFTKTPKTNTEGITYVSLEELLGGSDIISIHVPHTSETHHLLNRENIQLCKKGSMLINTARGGVIETQGVLEALDKGILKGVGLDVLEEECNLREERELLSEDFFKTCDIKTQLLNHVLLTRKDVIVTPHNAFNSTESLKEILDITVDSIKAFLSGKPKNIVS